MWKKAVIGLMMGLAAWQAGADEASVKKAFEAAYPKIKVDSVTKTPFPALYEVVAGDELLYTDEGLNYLFVEGSLVDAKSKRNLTLQRQSELEEKRTEQSKIDFSSLPLEQAIKVVRGNGSRKLVVFSDPDCPYCKKLEQDALSKLTDVTIYTLLYPIASLHPDAARKSKLIWCAPDRAKAWEDWVLRGQLAKGSSSCETPLDKIADLARKLGINGTPTLYFTSGRSLRGAYPLENIEKELNKSSAKSK